MYTCQHTVRAVTLSPVNIERKARKKHAQVDDGARVQDSRAEKVPGSIPSVGFFLVASVYACDPLFEGSRSVQERTRLRGCFEPKKPPQHIYQLSQLSWVARQGVCEMDYITTLSLAYFILQSMSLCLPVLFEFPQGYLPVLPSPEQGSRPSPCVSCVLLTLFLGHFYFGCTKSPNEHIHI